MERQHRRVCKAEEEVKGQLGSCYQEHGRLEMEDKVKPIFSSQFQTREVL